MASGSNYCPHPLPVKLTNEKENIHMSRLDDGTTQAVREGLLDCVEDSDVWLEYGIIEYRFKSKYPDLYGILLQVYGHRKLGQMSYSTSSYLGKQLGVLASGGAILTRRHRITTGYWLYLHEVTHAAGAPAPSEDRFLSWHDFATREGLDPNVWTLGTP